MDVHAIDFTKVLKWALVVLITGFIAQFGKSFATYIMGKIRAGRTAGKKGEGKAGGPSAAPSSRPPQDTLRIEKREIPMQDGESTPSEKQEPVETKRPSADLDEKDQAKLKKKALKAQVKQRKKAAKKP